MVKIAITGANSYTGQYVAQMLRARNQQILNISSSKRQHSLGDLESMPYDFQCPMNMTRNLEGVNTLVNTYWVRFNNHKGMSRQQTVDNSKLLIDSAKQAGVKRIVFVSHTQTQLDSPFEYIRGKAQVEEHIRNSGLEYAIIKPCALFGETPNESIVINNIAYMLRTFPTFVLPGNGKYHLQPVHVRDMAEMIVEQVLQEGKVSSEMDAVGEKFEVQQMVKTMRDIMGLKRLVLTGMPLSFCYYASKPVDWWFQDKFVEIDDLSLMINGVTQSHGPVTGQRKLTDFLKQYKDTIGMNYINSTARYYK